jgi:hypothetical protein
MESDKCPLGAMPKPGKDAIVSQYPIVFQDTSQPIVE